MTYNIEYLNSIDKSIVKNICDKLNCSLADIFDIEPIKAGLTNITFSFRIPSGHYVYRCPGVGTKQIINRESEAFSESIAKALDIDDSYIIMDTTTGWKLSKFVEDYEYINPQDAYDRVLAMKTLHILHDSHTISKWDFDYYQQTNNLIKLKLFTDMVDFSEYIKLHNRMAQVDNYLKENKYPVVLCHNDSWAWNMLKNNNKVTFIDWEYSGNSYPAADVAYFTGSYNSDDADYMNLAEIYEGHELSNREKIYYFAVMALVFWYWFVWALYKEALGKKIDDKQLWYNKAIHALEVVEAEI